MGEIAPTSAPIWAHLVPVPVTASKQANAKLPNSLLRAVELNLRVGPPMDPIRDRIITQTDR